MAKEKRFRLYVGMALAMLAFSSPALAADVAVRKAPPVTYAEPATNWSGFYVGVNAGYAWSNSVSDIRGNEVISQTALAMGIVPSSLKTDPNGWLAGGTVGYNMQFGNIVAGVEADMAFADVDGGDSKVFSLAPLGLPANVTTESRSGFDWLATIRGRVGFLLTNSLLLYGTGGLAVADTYNETTVTLTTPFAGINGTAAGSASGVEWGWVAGAGVEYAMNSKWSLKGEYLYVDLGDRDYQFGTTIAGTPVSFNASTDNQYHISRVGLNYKF